MKTKQWMRRLASAVFAAALSLSILPVCPGGLFSPLPVYAEDDCRHEWSGWEMDYEATCGSDGWKYRICDICGEYQEEVIPATGDHEWSDWTVDQEATCVEDGNQSRYCMTCYESEIKVIPATGVHLWNDWVEEIEPTCGAEGLETRYCYNCDEEESRAVAPTGDHSWGDWETAKKATIKKAGAKVRECDDCSATQTKTVAKLKPYAKFGKKTYSLKTGKTVKLTAKYASGDKVKKWKSSKPSVASVNAKGKVKGKKAGKAKITVTMKSGKKASCQIVVKRSAGKSGSKSSSGTGIVYWTPAGKVYHKSKKCTTLKRSRTIRSGTVEESGKSRACKVCG